MATQSSITAALYCRLAHRDTIGLTMRNQKQRLADYALECGYNNYIVYEDNGFSGLQYDRPAFTQMLSDIDSGKIGVVIVTNRSRIGRGQMQTQRCINEISAKGAAFISIACEHDPITDLFQLLSNLEGGGRK